MMHHLLIIRHGNTFAAGSIPKRVGARTDIPLTSEGCDQIRALCKHLHQQDLHPEQLLTSPLIRTQQTAGIIQSYFHIQHPLLIEPDLLEIDYGPDENKTEEEVSARIGQEALQAWQLSGVFPDGWSPSRSIMCSRWSELLKKSEKLFEKHQTIALITSQGVARFAPYFLNQTSAPRLATAHYGHFIFYHGHWSLHAWNTSIET